MMMETTKLCFLISVWMTLAFIEGHSCARNQKLLLFFLNFADNSDEIQYVAITCWFVEAHAKLILQK